MHLALPILGLVLVICSLIFINTRYFREQIARRKGNDLADDIIRKVRRNLLMALFSFIVWLLATFI